MSKILVSGGNIGSAVAIELAKRKYEVSVLARKVESNESFSNIGIKYAVADAAKPETLDAVFQGVDTFFFVSPLIENMVEQSAELIKAAKKAGVKYIVRSSARGASKEAPIIMGRLHGEVEDILKNSGIAYTMLQPASFFQNLLGSATTIKNQNDFYGSSGKGQNAHVDVKDIAAVAVTAIVEGAAVHAGNSYVVTGSEILNYDDMASELSKQTGRDIKYINLSPKELGKTYLRYGMPQWTVNALLELDNIIRLGYVASASDDVKKVTGKNPVTFREFVKENIAAF